MTINPNWYQPNLYERDLFTPGEAVRFATELSQLLVANIADEPTVAVEVEEFAVLLIIDFGGHREPWHVEIQRDRSDVGSVGIASSPDTYPLDSDPAITSGKFTAHHQEPANPYVPMHPTLACPATLGPVRCRKS